MDTQKRWISIVEYAKTANLSISTVRRRIKDKKVVFKKQNGKFYIFCNLPTFNVEENSFKMIKSLREENRKLRELLSEQTMLIDLYEKKLNGETKATTGIWGNYTPQVDQ